MNIFKRPQFVRGYRRPLIVGWSQHRRMYLEGLRSCLTTNHGQASAFNENRRMSLIGSRRNEICVGKR